MDRKQIDDSPVGTVITMTFDVFTKAAEGWRARSSSVRRLTGELLIVDPEFLVGMFAEPGVVLAVELPQTWVITTGDCAIDMQNQATFFGAESQVIALVAELNESRVYVDEYEPGATPEYRGSPFGYESVPAITSAAEYLATIQN